MEFRIDNMTCGGCVRSVTKTVQSVDPHAKVDINLDTKKVSVSSDRDAAAFMSALEDVGYPAHAVS